MDRFTLTSRRLLAELVCQTSVDLAGFGWSSASDWHQMQAPSQLDRSRHYCGYTGKSCSPGTARRSKTHFLVWFQLPRYFLDQTWALAGLKPALRFQTWPCFYWTSTPIVRYWLDHPPPHQAPLFPTYSVSYWVWLRKPLQLHFQLTPYLWCYPPFPSSESKKYFVSSTISWASLKCKNLQNPTTQPQMLSRHDWTKNAQSHDHYYPFLKRFHHRILGLLIYMNYKIGTQISSFHHQ